MFSQNNPMNIGHKLNVLKTFRRLPETTRLIYVQCPRRVDSYK